MKSIALKVFRTAQIKEIDAYTIAHEPVASIDLMERAARACTEWLVKHIPVRNHLFIFCGPGNNGGDGLAIARQMHERYYSVTVFIVETGGTYSEDFLVNEKRLQNHPGIQVIRLKQTDKLPVISDSDVVIDAIFGSGLSRPADGLAAAVIRHMNASGVPVISIDIPSGLFGEDNQNNIPDHIIHAAHTLTFQFPKLAFFFPQNNPFTGQWHMLDIGLHHEIIHRVASEFYYTCASDVKPFLRQRQLFSHKGSYGHGLLIAGSYGMMGAAILSARACLKTGVGLVTAHVPRLAYPIVQTAVPESLFNIDRDDHHFTGFSGLDKYTAVGIGPAISCEPDVQKGLREMLQACKLPMVMDADAINILARNKEWLDLLCQDTILTPHLKEFERLVGKFDDPWERNRQQIAFSRRYKVYIVLKGAFSAITCPDGTCWFNSKGNPGMATGGSGDVLTGMILSLLAQGYPAKEAAILGTYLHGLAGDLAAQRMGMEAVTATGMIRFIGPAYNELRKY